MNTINRRALLSGMLGGLIICVTGSVGCAAVAMTWISMGLSLIATITPTIPAIISAFASLVGKNISAAQLAKIQSIFAGISNILTQVETAIKAFEANPVGSTLQEIRNLLNTLVANLNIPAILNDLQITDPAVVTKITSIINVVLGLATDLLNLVPSTTAALSPRVQKKLSIAMNPNVFAAKLNTAIWAKSGNPDIDSIFEKIQANPIIVKQ